MQVVTPIGSAEIGCVQKAFCCEEESEHRSSGALRLECVVIKAIHELTW